MNAKRIAGLMIAAVSLVPLSGLAEEADDFGSWLASGDASLAARYRFEHVDQENITEKADASTLRLRLNYKTGQWNGWSAFAEYDYVAHVLLRDFDSDADTSPNKTQFPVVADPKGSDLNQLYFDYKKSDDWFVRIGRQRILLDNQRFVGGVGWRQNEQTYDGLTLNTSAISNTTLQYTYVAEVRRIFGERSPGGSDDSQHHLLNAKIKLNDSWSATPYAYLLDYQDVTRFGASSTTIGVRVAGSVAVGEGKLALVGEFATQSDAGDNPANYDADYIHAEAMWAIGGGMTLGASYESLGSDNGVASFQTPLATGHKFQGWADRFLSTPSGGVEDLYFTAKYKAGDWNLTGVYHDFSVETGAGDYGDEIDISAGRSFGGRYGILFKGAFFSGDMAGFPDTDKFWIMLTASY
jgi:hypothetical protein